MKRLGIVGGTFDPVHRGHLDIAAAAEQALRLTGIVFIPAHVPPHRAAPVASGYHRFAMVALAIAQRDRWRVSDVELRSAGPSYTAGTLAHLHGLGYAPTELVFIIGADAFAEIATWYDYPRILDGAHFAVVSRPGFPVREIPARLGGLAARMIEAPADAAAHAAPVIFLIDAPTADVAATAIRRRLAAGESIDGMVPASVRQHIEQHGLYRSTVRGDEAQDGRPVPAAGRLHGQD